MTGVYESLGGLFEAYLEITTVSGTANLRLELPASLLAAVVLNPAALAVCWGWSLCKGCCY